MKNWVLLEHVTGENVVFDWRWYLTATAWWGVSGQTTGSYWPLTPAPPGCWFR